MGFERATTDSRVQGSSSKALSKIRIKGRRVSKVHGSHVGASIAGPKVPMRTCGKTAFEAIFNLSLAWHFLATAGA